MALSPHQRRLHVAQQPATSLTAPCSQRAFNLPEFLLLTQALWAVMVTDICWDVLPAWPWAVRLIHSVHRQAVK